MQKVLCKFANTKTFRYFCGANIKNEYYPGSNIKSISEACGGFDGQCVWDPADGNIYFAGKLLCAKSYVADALWDSGIIGERTIEEWKHEQ